ncbi:TPA: hypothetical protein HA249_05645 [Candidatus Woesearchaeota archaeon]|nr:hypothetical protein [Candidatus Woesearchaeota archaeon]HIH47585.1 hypothetical protein [Candidatus Woesearchaeota archaeon]HII88318.1 hypothetical protein [Candidatus Woesearchaeota archaeon]
MDKWKTIKSEEQREKRRESKDNTLKLIMGLLIAILFITLFNSLRLSFVNGALENMNSALAVQTGLAPSNTGNIGSSQGQQPRASLPSTSSLPSVVPTGVPKIYGPELKINFDDVSANDPEKADATIRALATFDQRITLEGEQLERYINILFKMNKGVSCEYCCGAPAIIFADGQPACGCAHSFAMRGLAKYLLTNHASEYTDEEIQEELGKWKTLFFPGQLQLKAQVLKDQKIPFNYVNLASNKYRGIEQGKSASGSGMVGGC